MLEVKIKIECPDILMAATALAKALTRADGHPAAPAPAPNPVQSPAAQPAAPVAPPAVPVATSPTYSLDQISRAGASLVDAGKIEQLLQLLNRYSVQAITQLQPEQYGAFATDLRALGAQI